VSWVYRVYRGGTYYSLITFCIYILQVVDPISKIRYSVELSRVLNCDLIAYLVIYKAFCHCFVSASWRTHCNNKERGVYGRNYLANHCLVLRET
jgi:hypothetical protein